MSPIRHVPLRALAGISQHHHAGLGAVGALHDGRKIVVKAPRDHKYRGAKFIQSHKHLLRRLSLRHNAHLVFHRQHLGDACPEDCLVIRQYQFEHVVCAPKVATVRISTLRDPHSVILSEAKGEGSSCSAYEFLINSYESITHATPLPSATSCHGFDRCAPRAPCTDLYVFLAAGYVGGQRDFKLHGRANLQRCVGADKHSRRAQISRGSLGVAARASLMDLDRQFQRKSFSGPRFGHNASSCVA